MKEGTDIHQIHPAPFAAMGGLTSRLVSAVSTTRDATWFRQATCSVLKAGGPNPRHVAIVMDGNRRFAESRNFHRQVGHEHGADKLTEVLSWCLALDVNVLSVYAFSLDNLKRDSEEVNGLFELATVRLNELASSNLIAEKKVRIRVVGDLSAPNVPDSFKKAAASCTTKTMHDSGPVLNVCFLYTGREDIAQAVGAIGAGVKNGKIKKQHVTNTLVEKCLRGAAFEAVCVDGTSEEAIGKAISPKPKKLNPKATSTVFDDLSVWDTDGSETWSETELGESTRDKDHKDHKDEGSNISRRNNSGITQEPPSIPPVDLLIRTSGETRLSDFILWGASQHAVLCFLEVLWPDFSFTDLVHAVWVYQRSAKKALKGRARFRAAQDCDEGLRDLRDESGAVSPASKKGFRDSQGNARVTQDLRRRKERKRNVSSKDVLETSSVSVAWVGVGDGGADRDDTLVREFVVNRNQKIVQEAIQTAGET